MMRLRTQAPSSSRLLIAAAFGLLFPVTVYAQQAPAPTRSCTVSHQPPSEADTTLWSGKFAEAEALYQAEPPSPARTIGLVRAMIGQRKLDEALALATTENKAHPDDPILLDALGEIRYRRGDILDAANSYNRSLELDPCSARTHFDIGRFMSISGSPASGQKQLDTAHKLAPQDAVITRAWEASQRVPMTAEQRLDQLNHRLQNPNLSEDEKARLQNSIKLLTSQQKGGCQLAEPVTSTKFSMMPMDNSMRPGGARAVGLEIAFNGKSKHLELDTGASGLMLTEEAARSLNLQPEAEILTGGLGDSGPRHAFVTHVDTLRVGTMTFHNCPVRVLESKSVLPGIDGLIGSDVFRSFLVTLDMPAFQVRLAPLPPRPDEQATVASLDTEGDDDPANRTIAERKQDRYIAPEMKDWTRVFRYGHLLIFPTEIGKASHKLFAMDTGAGTTLISPQAAREVTSVGSDSSQHIKGISGEVDKVSSTGSLYLQFGGVRQYADRLTSIDTSGITRNAGVEIAGFIGFPTLRELVISIDYRDNLVKLTYTPHASINR